MERTPNQIHDDELSGALRKLRRRTPPPQLSSALRVIASRELERRVRGAGIGIKDRLRLASDNLMRPLALPFAGGLFSALALFAMWVIPTYPLRGSSAADIPIIWTTQAAVKQIGPVAASDDVVVDVTVDDTGRMVDYRIVSGVANDDELRRNIENFLIFTVFQPATSLGQPVQGKIRLSLQSSHIDVKG